MTKQELLHHLESFNQTPNTLLINSKNLPNYLAIINAGRDIIPILVDLLLNNQYPRTCILALTVITDEIPFSPDGKTGLTEIRNAWLDWAVKNGYSTRFLGQYV